MYKGTPNQKRKIQITLASLTASNSHIDLIAFCYEVIVEEVEKINLIDELSEEKELTHYEVIDSINKQFGIDKEIEIYKFISYLKDLYVTDLRGNRNHIASKKSLVYFDDDEKIISPNFDADLIFTELQTFYIDTEILKKVKEKIRNNE